MKSRLVTLSVTLLVAGSLAGCSAEATKAPDVSASINQSLQQASLKDVSVSQDRDKGVVTLKGHVATDSEKSQAESIANGLAAGEVVANQIEVLPPGAESDAKAVDSDLDKGIEKNLDAALVERKLQDGVSFSAKMGVVTLTGEVNSQAKRSTVEKVASSVPNVKQVVNDVQVKNQKATSSEK